MLVLLYEETRPTVDDICEIADVASGGCNHASSRPTPLCRLERIGRLPLYLHVWWNDGWRLGMGYMYVQVMRAMLKPQTRVSQAPTS